MPPEMTDAVRRVPVRTGDFIDTLTMFKDAHLDLARRVDALDGGETKSAKPRVRMPARGLGFRPKPGDAYQTKDMNTFWLRGHGKGVTGDIYETTDGVTFRLVKGR